MATMRAIKRRKESIQSTEQITKAMKLVSTVKLQKARARAESTKPYFEAMYTTVAAMLAKSGNIMNPYLQSGASQKKAIIVITSNRGLAGGYNANVCRLVMESGIPKEDALLYTIGQKGKEILSHKGYALASDYSEVINAPLYSDAAAIGKEILQAFADDQIGEIYLAYTSFKNTVTHEPKLLKLLPVEMDTENISREEQLTPMNYEPEEDEAIGRIIPKYLCSLIYGALLEAAASENGARMQAMDSATSNAEKMIDDLTLMYNRARQSSITQELTEIIGGAEALS
ncbi:ATP synthase F1 subunit gamma [Lachnotalea sp. AF33-28]|jgi:F-type H+-transporting ATPase subunit gamma|uniref:ATP synthase F1 subunit gamma n=1 Tax=Lachnotalea sp. AF33-28 TaxID=2292046 RepID=UPI000E49A7D8|nr:ATP synthase F1 subunit gamma [Lachnotalea sp. AF33-28]RHP36408.1 ATP synthase F1 subunit gamma [Lachnotalea sp. AF33-28]